MTPSLASGMRIRSARFSDAGAIAALNNRFASEGVMLFRKPDQIALSIDDYIVATNVRGTVIACGALKEYAPSLAEVAAIAVAPEAHGKGLGKAIVRAVEELALKRGTTEIFALTLEPGFFEAVGFQRVERARYPEKIRRDCIGCARRFACIEICFAKEVGTPKKAAA
ncbi:MAG: GNAT family N-acetyltransferase [Anaerolineae bacterium]|nr:GNAT family N-acetyltransferase [Gemmatimonadaceae bacterium]